MFCGGIGQMLAALVLIGAALIHRRELAARYWAVGYLMLALGTPLFFLRGAISDFLSIVVANSLTCFGAYLIYVGVAQFERRPKYWRLGLGLVSASALGLVYWTYIDPSLPARVIVTNLAIIPCSWMIARALLRTRMSSQRVVPWAIAGLFIAVVIGNIFRMVDAVFRWGGLGSKAFDAPLLAVWLAMTLAFVFLSATGFVVMIQLRVQARLDRLANHDPLTGLLNRRAFRLQVIDALRRARQGPVAGTLLLMDLDRFKQLNDQFGHLAGDRVLRAFAGVLITGLPPAAIIGRFGGDEFCVLLPGVGIDEASRHAEHIRCATEVLAVVIGPALIRVQVSIGLAELPPGLSYNKLLRRADHALYRAKSAGRNAVVGAASAHELVEPAPLAR